MLAGLSLPERKPLMAAKKTAKATKTAKIATNATVSTLNSATHNALPGPDDIAREVLPNGIVILAREDFTTASVVINGLLQVGSVFESPAQSGLSNIVAGALMRGTKTRSFDEIHETLEGLP